MIDVGQKEKVTQERVLKLFVEQMGYEYIGNLRRGENGNVVENLFRKFLRENGYSDTSINQAFFYLQKSANDNSRDLYEVNKEIYNLLRYGIKVKESKGENYQTVWPLNWEEPQKKSFLYS